MKESSELDLGAIDWNATERLFLPDKERFFSGGHREEKLSPRTKDILKVLAAGVIIGLSFVVPTAPMALGIFLLDGKQYKRHRFNHAVRRLAKQKMVEIEETVGGTMVRITREGRKRALQYKLDELSVEKPAKWDGKWRIVIFDIPENRRRLRDIFRHRLQLLGFYQLQESVWVYPYPCQDQIEFLRHIYGVDVSVRYIIAQTIENAEDLQEHFKENNTKTHGRE